MTEKSAQMERFADRRVIVTGAEIRIDGGAHA